MSDTDDTDDEGRAKYGIAGGESVVEEIRDQVGDDDE